MTEETRFNSDKAEPQLNVRELDSLFNVDRASVPEKTDDSNKQLQEITDMRKEIQTLTKNADPDPDSILHENITRANRLLDLAEKDLATGMDNRRLEVMAGLINAITTASASIMGESYNQQVLENKSRELDIKEQQVLLKNTLKGDKTVTNNNLIVTNREDLLKMISDEQDNVVEAEVEEVVKK